MRRVCVFMCVCIRACVQVLHNLSLWSAADEPDTPLKMDVAMEAARNAKKHMKMVKLKLLLAVYVLCLVLLHYVVSYVAVSYVAVSYVAPLPPEPFLCGADSV